MNKEDIREFKRLFTQFHLCEMSDIELLDLAMVIDSLRWELECGAGRDSKRLYELDMELKDFARELQRLVVE